MLIILHYQDTIKTRLQVERNVKYAPYHPYFRDGGMINCARSIIYANNDPSKSLFVQGFNNLYRGFSAQALRSTIGTAFMFYSYEMSRYMLRDLFI